MTALATITPAKAAQMRLHATVLRETRLARPDLNPAEVDAEANKILTKLLFGKNGKRNGKKGKKGGGGKKSGRESFTARGVRESGPLTASDVPVPPATTSPAPAAPIDPGKLARDLSKLSADDFEDVSTAAISVRAGRMQAPFWQGMDSEADA